MTTAASIPDVAPASHPVMAITGASSGIGRSLGRVAARDGYAVLAIARRRERLDALAAEIVRDGGSCAVAEIDVCAADAPARLLAAALAAFGRLDVLVNNAGIGATGRLLELTDAQIEAQWQLHVAAPLRLARTALPELRARRGQIVFFGSGIARVALPNYGAYALAKSAIRAAATQLRRELRADGIAVSYVDPGLVATEFHERIGIERAPGIPAMPAERVARAILRGIRRRKASIQGTTWQGIGTTLGEWAGPLLDGTAAKMGAQFTTPPIKSSTTPAVAAPSAMPQVVTPSVSAASSRGAFDAALAPVARRMERVNLPAEFISTTLVAGDSLDLNEVAMRWAGMPNKNERAALREVFDALTAAGYLEPTEEERWTVLRAAE